MLPVFELWAHVVALAAVRGKWGLHWLSQCSTTGCRPPLPTTSLPLPCMSGTSRHDGAHALHATTPACTPPPSSPSPQEVPAELTAEQACSPACAELVGSMTEMLGSLVSLSHLDDAGPQQVGRRMCE